MFTEADLEALRALRRSLALRVARAEAEDQVSLDTEEECQQIIILNRIVEHAETPLPDKTSAALKVCRDKLALYGVAPHRAPAFEVMPTLERTRMIQHCLWMCDEAQRYLDNGKWAKGMRWLCFVQGVCWTQGIFSINDLRDQNR